MKLSLLARSAFPRSPFSFNARLSFDARLAFDAHLRRLRKIRFSGGLTLSWGLCIALVVTQVACDREKKEELSAQQKQARVEALLKQSGADVAPQDDADARALEKQGSEATSKTEPRKLSPGSEGVTGSTNENPGATAETGLSPDATPGAQAESTSEESTGERVAVKLLSAGNEPRKTLRYQFHAGRKRNFSLDMEIAPTRTVNGQATPGAPPIALSVTGTTQTVGISGSLASREYTFLDIVPSVNGIPPQVAEQMKAEFQKLRGIGLVEQVTTLGQVQNVGLKQEMLSPQVLALMQYLTDGMTNAFLPLPKEPVGVGAKWQATTTAESSGLSVTQNNTVLLTSLQGDTVTVEMTHQQTAPSQEVQSPNLPPGVKVEVIKVEGSGTGKMVVDLAQVTADAKVDLSMLVDTRVTQPGAPGPLTESGTTKMRAHIRMTN